MSAPPVRTRRGVTLAGLALACVLLAPFGLAPLGAGPLEARQAWEQARALGARPWRERARAWRRVRTLAGRHDPIVGRALAAEARLLREVARVHAAAALEARAAAVVPAHDPERAQRRAVQARGLCAEGDRAAARAPWEEAALVARRETPWRADEALEELGTLAAEEGDGAGLRLALARAQAQESRASTRLRLWGALGLLLLAQGDRPGAEQALRQAERAFAQAAHADAREAARAAKDWLDLELRRRLRPG